jgi:hypothetical protein
VKVKLLTAVLVAGSAAFGFVPMAAASTDVKLTPGAAAWYQPNPTCAQASGCVSTGTLPALPVAPPVPVPDVPLSPVPAGTMHIGYAGGQETARSYLAFPYDSVDGTVTAASLDIPLDVTTESGSALPETAKVQACLLSGDLTPTEGSIGQPPTAACDQHATLKYVATPTPHLHADLKPLMQGLLTTTGLALLPDATEVSPDDAAWRVVFSAATRTDTAKTPLPTLTLTVDPTPETEVPDVPVDVPVDTGTGAVAQPNIPVTTPLDPVAVPDLGPAPTVDQPTTVLPPTQNTAAPQTKTVGYAYPVVWLLPLVFLLVVPAVARALTRDLTPITIAED